MRRFSVVVALALAGCASHVQPSSYTRIDGQPADAARTQTVLAQCKGEAALVPQASGSGILGLVAVSDQATRENSVLDA